MIDLDDGSTMKDDKMIETKILIGGIADGEEVSAFLNGLSREKDKCFDDYIVLYIDFLGMQELMNSESDYDALQIIRFLIRNAKRTTKAMEKVNRIGDFSIKYFSDNIVIAQKVDQEKIGDQIVSILNMAFSLQFWSLVQFGFMMRGGITVGKMHIDNDIVWGTGLVESYSIESNIAIYPRIVVSEKVVDLYDKNKNHTLNLHAFLRRDFDGVLFVDYLIACPNLAVIPQISESLKEKFQPYKNKSDRIKQKINWTIRYFNDYCSKYSSRDYRGEYSDSKLEYL